MTIFAEVENVAEAVVAWRVGVEKSDNPSISHMYSLQMFMPGSHYVASFGFRQSCFMLLCYMEKVNGLLEVAHDLFLCEAS